MAQPQEERVFHQLYVVLVKYVMDEAHRAHQKHAEHSFIRPYEFTDDARLKFLVEEVGEVARAMCDGDEENLRDELVQVAHLAAAWVAVLDVEHADELMMEVAVDASR